MQIRILVVDEAAFVRDALKRSVRRFLKDVDVFDAVNGRRALPILRGNKISIVICEWEVAEMSGAELLKWMREDDSYAKTPFIGMSDAGNRDMIMEAVKSGASDFMNKPFSPDEVQKKVVKQLARIGFVAKPPNPGGLTSGLDALTGKSAKKPNASTPNKPKPKPNPFSPSRSNDNPPVRASAPGRSIKGKATIDFPNSSGKYELLELSLTGFSTLIERELATNIHVFLEGKADIQDSKDNPLAQLNIYIHGLQATENNPQANQVRLIARFANNEPEKFELLSKSIAKGG